MPIYVKQLQVEISSFQVLCVSELLPAALIMNRLEFVSQLGAELKGLAQHAGNVTDQGGHWFKSQVNE